MSSSLSRKQQLPRHRNIDDDRLKLHLRLITIKTQTYRVITLRPTARVKFSTNYFHDTWHIISNLEGAKLIARFLWGLSYQKQPGTLIVVSGENLQRTPFESDKSTPFVLINSQLTVPDARAFRILKQRLKHLPLPDQTIRWQTFGMQKFATQQEEDYQSYNPTIEWKRDPIHYQENEYLWKQEKMTLCGGLICYCAPPAILRAQSISIDSIRTSCEHSRNMDYRYLDENYPRCWGANGEVQIFHDYHQRLRRAALAKREVMTNSEVMINQSSETNVEILREAIHRQASIIEKRNKMRKR